MSSSLPELPRMTVPLEIYYFDTDAGEEMNRTGLVAVVARTEIDYLRPARLGDSLRVTAELFRLEKVRMMMRFEITSAKEPEKVFIRCVQTMVAVQLPGGRPQRVPAAWREAYPQLAAP
jgi:acyl-CoA thioesterase FadM